MGLDMYLQLGNGENAKEVGYWRKANAIHNYFVNNIQDGDDDQGVYLVDKDTFLDLFTIVNDIIDLGKKAGLKLGDGEDNYEYNSDVFENKKYDKEKFERLCSYCDEYLPTISGFFFGDTEYDLWYFDQLDYTHNLLNDILKNWDNKGEEDYYYTSWW